MQDIPRNELLDKLAAGWKVRTKAYGKNTLNNLEELQGIDLKCLIQDDWEGEPPELMCVYCGLKVDSAFRYLRVSKFNLKFIRRKSWPCTKFLKDDSAVELLVSDIVAEDWEVWG